MAATSVEPWIYLSSFNVFSKRHIKVTHSPELPRVGVTTLLEWLLEKFKDFFHSWSFFEYVLFI
jgi:hypothetical protein